jgi:nicotinate-nucleotide adenylyltransferase
MVVRSIGDYPKMKASDIEFGMSKPSYTAHTLAFLKERHPTYDLMLLMGSDNVVHFDRWKNWEWIMKGHRILVYPRKGSIEDARQKFPNFEFLEVPEIEISSTYIRESVKTGKDVRFYMREEGYEYMKEMNFYKK